MRGFCPGWQDSGVREFWWEHQALGYDHGQGACLISVGGRRPLWPRVCPGWPDPARELWHVIEILGYSNLNRATNPARRFGPGRRAWDTLGVRARRPQVC